MRPTSADDVIDSREVIDAIAELREMIADTPDDDKADELAALEALAEQCEHYVDDWEVGETLVRDSYFEQYARDLATDLGAIPDTYSWPVSHIDWAEAARHLQMDYVTVTFDGITYWVR